MRSGRAGLRARSREDRGEAVTEFIVIVLLLLVPLGYAGTAVLSVQAAGAASAHAVREAGRALTLAADPGAAIARARIAAEMALADQGFVVDPEALTIRCGAAGCLVPGSEAVIALAWDAPLPWLPSWLGSSAAVPVRAEHSIVIDRYRDGA